MCLPLLFGMQVQNRALTFPTPLLMDSGPAGEGEVGKDLFSYKCISIFMVSYGLFCTPASSSVYFFAALPFSPFSPLCAAIPSWSNMTRARMGVQCQGAICFLDSPRWQHCCLSFCAPSGQTEEILFSQFLQYPGGGRGRTQRLFHTTSCHLPGMGEEQGGEGSLPGRRNSF